MTAALPDDRPRASRLVLEFRAGDKMLVNGAALQFRTRASVVLSNRVRFLFGKQILAPEDASTPARRVYFAVQAAYVCEDSERPRYLEMASTLAAEYAEATTSAIARRMLEQAIIDLEAGNCWEAMRRIRELFAHDDAVLPPPQA
ncbi:flagellar biosynthesis repressor FlbT [Falsiroseomonas selenitidurans]|uniref:Flagellar biosynthesis repressor FlbT n=1 Tax=Falsiroseomonas selenitidurans TaxID=2716335 RepID=A0ABX1EAY9_9PROT|nr:flagellar biosynthesis repressor FlbT [Falsiroseomonas selenitidurans]NKC34005.1 flagellar biosynthesis repressor FlbT [Falsiroseomonas selenitidurans]